MKSNVLESYYQQSINESYAKVNERGSEFLRAVVAFGALLDEVGAYLGSARGGKHDGEGLRTWLTDNCPEVNYNTAKGYKALASKCAAMIGGGTQALAALQGRDKVTAPGTTDVIDIDATIIQKRDELFAAADSRRKLEQMYFAFAGGGTTEGKNRPGRPKGTVATLPAERKSDVLAAAEFWGKLMHAIAKNRGAYVSGAALLELVSAQAWLAELEMLAKALKARIAEG